jgi:hypothetical protein
LCEGTGAIGAPSSSLCHPAVASLLASWPRPVVALSLWPHRYQWHSLSTQRAGACSGGGKCRVAFVALSRPHRPRWRSSMAVSTRYPPCEQWRAAAVAGARSSLGRHLFRGVAGRLVVTWREYGDSGSLPCGYPAAWASRHLHGAMLDPNEPLTCHLDGEEGLHRRRASSSYIENIT